MDNFSSGNIVIFLKRGKFWFIKECHPSLGDRMGRVDGGGGELRTSVASL